jgi:hypothetical protein
VESVGGLDPSIRGQLGALLAVSVRFVTPWHRFFYELGAVQKLASRAGERGEVATRTSSTVLVDHALGGEEACALRVRAEHTIFHVSRAHLMPDAFWYGNVAAPSSLAVGFDAPDLVVIEEYGHRRTWSGRAFHDHP